MSSCPSYPLCGGCLLRHLDERQYRQQKEETFKKNMSRIRQDVIPFGESVFIPDGTRRRAAFAFSYIKKKLKMGFNAAKSNEIIDCSSCCLLTERLNTALPQIRHLLEAVCAENYTVKKGKKTISQTITGGDVLLCCADNGIDVLLEMPCAPELGHRMAVAEAAGNAPDIIRVSWRCGGSQQPETLLEKIPPFIDNNGITVYIPSGTFLQASAAGEQALISLVLKYLGNREGNIADLFCGVGTFSYPLAKNKNNRIWAIDSSVELLEGFRRSVNRNQLPNIKIEAKNLFKYPLDEAELSTIDVVVFDPPRAGAAAQVKELAKAQNGPKTVIAVSCNPHTFVNDADMLIAGGYTLKEITMVDQFVYSGHTELVALFEKE